MLGKQIITRAFEYNFQTNLRLLELAGNVSPEQLDAPREYSQGSLLQTLAHLFAVEWMWAHICQKHDRPERFFTAEDFPTLEAMREHALQEQERLRAFLEGRSEDDLAAEFVMMDRRGQPRTLVLWRVLMHMLFHAAQHRSEAAALLTEYGQSPGDVDFIFFEG
jgi:uncharacterized damage-inducible protein DinB